MTPTHIVCHYAEIGIKGKNRVIFERKLKENIERAVGGYGRARVVSGRILVELQKDARKNTSAIAEQLCRVFGIAHFSFAVRGARDIDAIQKVCRDTLSEKMFETFRIECRRSDKKFAITSQKVNERVGEHIVTTLHKRVRLKEPDVTCFIEILEREAFIYTEKINGPGGLPVGVSGKVVVMLSGGIDSPVAAWYAMKRGARSVFVHFHSVPQTSRASLEKVEDIAKILSGFQGKSAIYFVPILAIQKEAVLKVPASLRVIVYRRAMFRIAQEIARRERANAIVTGDALGQVASQTLENIAAIEDAVSIPVLRPLIGFDKQEIIEKAKEIGTYDISILPHDDCCSLFLPKHPETKARLEDVRMAEERIDVEMSANDARENATLEFFD